MTINELSEFYDAYEALDAAKREFGHARYAYLGCQPADRPEKLDALFQRRSEALEAMKKAQRRFADAWAACRGRDRAAEPEIAAALDLLRASERPSVPEPRKEQS